MDSTAWMKCALWMAVGPLACPAWAQTGQDPSALLQELVRQNARLQEQNAKLQASLEALQARVSLLETTSNRPAAESAAAASAPSGETTAAGAVPSAAIDPPAPPSHRHDLIGASGLKFRGFATAQFQASNALHNKGSFRPAEMSLLLSDALSDHWHAVAEINFEADDNFETAVDVERLQVVYEPNENFELGVGRLHSRVSYFNTAFHHGRWLETTTDRPRIVQFPDAGGVLPMHKTGLSVAGIVPHSGALGLHYFAELGANPDYGNNANAFATGLYLKPSALEGWQAGFSYQRARMTLANVPARLQENIFGTHLVYRTSRWEFLNEAFLISHQVPTQRTYRTAGFYSLLSRGIASWRPFVQYQYVNANELDPLYPGLGRQDGPSVGLRYDLAEHTAFKAEYFRQFQRYDDAVNRIAVQVDWFF